MTFVLVLMVWPLALFRMMLWIWLAPILFRTWVEPPFAPGMVTPVSTGPVTVGTVTVVWGVLAAVLAVVAPDAPAPLLAALAALFSALETAPVAVLTAGVAMALAAPVGLDAALLAALPRSLSVEGVLLASVLGLAVLPLPIPASASLELT